MGVKQTLFSGGWRSACSQEATLVGFPSGIDSPPNKSTVQTRDRIQELADPIKFLADVMDGKRMAAAGDPGDMKTTWVWPTLPQRIQAGEVLLRKLLPDLKATELTGDLQPMITLIEHRIVDLGSESAE